MASVLDPVSNADSGGTHHRGGTHHPGGTSHEPRPNFVFIMTDTQATNVIGAYKGIDLHTPSIDRLAETGIKFERAYTTCPLCTPARAGIFTGIYPHTAGAWTNNLPLGDNIKTMGQRFQDAGYHTGYIGKWHLDGHDYFGTGICPPGWDPDHWFDGKNYLDELTEAEITLWRRELNSLEDLQQHDVQAEFTWAHRISDRAERFLKQRADATDERPFVLVVSYDEPHHPFTCPPEYVGMFEDFDYPLGPAAFDTLEGKPAHQREWAASANVDASTAAGTVRLPMYLGANSFVDYEIGRVIDAVHQVVPENTWIIYTSDHGDMMGAHQLTGKGPVMYEEIAHIPLIIEPPTVGGPDGGGKHHNIVRKPVASTVSHIDLLPTMMDLANMPLLPILEGESLAPLLKGDAQPDRFAVLEFQRYEIEHDSWGGFQPVRAITQGRYKLVVNLLHTDEFYDMHADPGEVVNRIADPELFEVRDQLHDRLLDWMYEKRDPFRGPAWERRPWRDSADWELKWRGEFRPRPADGYAPEVRDYDTGLPTRGVKVEYGK